MAISTFDSPLYAPLFSDAEVAALLGDAAFVARMVEVEAALARATAQAGLIPEAAGRAIEAVLEHALISPEDLGVGMASAGVPVPDLVAMLRKLDGDAGRYLHWGATSQDIVDCAHLLQWRAVLEVFEQRLTQLLDSLQAASTRFDAVPMAGRTRSQIATPISFGLRIAQWAQPLIHLADELPAMRARLLRVQFGGASGAGSAVGMQAAHVSAALADALGLADSACWHTDRSAQVALGGWLTSLTAALAKMAGDLILMGRSEIGEARAGSGGGSSTMPQKSNPVAAEAIVSLATVSSALQSGLHIAARPVEERDGAAWAVEWMILPQLGTGTAAALRHAQGLVQSLEADVGRMAEQLAQGHGAVMAEAASFALAAHMSRTEAGNLVKEALCEARAQNITLAKAVASDPRIADLEEWAAVLDPVQAIAPAQAMSARIWAMRRNMSPK